MALIGAAPAPTASGEPLAVDAGEDGVEQLCPRPVRRCAFHVVDAPPRDQRSLILGKRGELFDEPGLADPGLTRQQDDPAVPCQRLVEGVLGSVQLRVAPTNGNRPGGNIVAAITLPPSCTNPASQAGVLCASRG